jgi:uncharacterized membrane protein (DUF441 family)
VCISKRVKGLLSIRAYDVSSHHVISSNTISICISCLSKRGLYVLLNAQSLVSCKLFATLYNRASMKGNDQYRNPTFITFRCNPFMTL